MEFYAVKALAALLKPPGLFALLLLAAAVAARRPRLVRGVGVVGAALLLVLSFVALVALANGLLSGAGSLFGIEGLTFQSL
ncbi:MAG TPA: hypothetical protein VHN38_10960, partial [Immundisolibacter sp.]|nr:hypothetical protein [Immundisolibacter sp.]